MNDSLILTAKKKDQMLSIALDENRKLREEIEALKNTLKSRNLQLEEYKRKDNDLSRGKAHISSMSKGLNKTNEENTQPIIIENKPSPRRLTPRNLVRKFSMLKRRSSADLTKLAIQKSIFCFLRK